MDTFREILIRLPSSIRQELEVLPNSVVAEIEEIRLRCGQNVRLLSGNLLLGITVYVVYADRVHPVREPVIRKSGTV